MWKCKCQKNNLLINSHCVACGNEMPNQLRTNIYRTELYRVKWARYKKTAEILKTKLTGQVARTKEAVTESQKILSGIPKLFLSVSQKCLIPIAAFVLIFAVIFSVQNPHTENSDIVSTATVKLEGIKNTISTQIKPDTAAATAKLAMTVKQGINKINPELKNNLKHKTVIILTNAVNIKTALPLHLKNTIEELNKK